MEIKKYERKWAIVKTVLLVLVAVSFVFPLIWMLSASLKTYLEVNANDFHLFGEKLMWSNYKTVWVDSAAPMLQAYINTLKIVIISVAGQIIIASLAAYAFAKIDFKGKNFIFMFFLASMMIPTQVTIIPRFILFRTMGLYNSHWAIILPNLFGASAIFMLRQFYLGLPSSLMEAAKLDGAGHFTIFSRIMMPLTKPAMITQIVLSVVVCWNDYLSPLVFLVKTDLYTVSQTVRWYIIDVASTNDHLMMAAASSAIIPMVILFLFSQRYFIEGVATSGVKG